VTDSYRDYAHQVSTKAAKGYLAARPGTSNHGWGLAADVQVGGYGSADYQWLLHNAPAYGWSNPGWARAGGSKHEPWHYEFNPAGAAA
jgi:LAS superfamily LD-carboxypeptidase LdcB